MKRLFLAALAACLLAPSFADAQVAGSPVQIQDPSTLKSATVNSDGSLKVNMSGGGGTFLPTNSSGAYSAVTIGTTASTIITAGACKVFCDIVNDSPTATICISVGSTATITGSACAAGEITIPPLWHRSWEGSYVPSDAISAIASSSSTPGAVGAK